MKRSQSIYKYTGGGSDISQQQQRTTDFFFFHSLDIWGGKSRHQDKPLYIKLTSCPVLQTREQASQTMRRNSSRAPLGFSIVDVV